MSVRVCEECTTRFAVGLVACPHCGSGHHHEETEADDMPKISRGDGPSYKGYLEPERVEDQAELERESAEATETDEEREEREEQEERELKGDGSGEPLPPAEERETGVTDPFRTDGGHLPAPEPVDEPVRPVTRAVKSKGSGK